MVHLVPSFFPAQFESIDQMLLGFAGIAGRRHEIYIPAEVLAAPQLRRRRQRGVRRTRRASVRLDLARQLAAPNIVEAIIDIPITLNLIMTRYLLDTNTTSTANDGTHLARRRQRMKRFTGV